MNRQHETSEFLRTKIRAVSARAGKLTKLSPASLGISASNRYAPSPAHFQAANGRLRNISRDIARRLHFLKTKWQGNSPETCLILIALVEKEIDRARRAFGLFFDVFSQRNSVFGPVLAAHDVIARDCYKVITNSAPFLLKEQLLRPLTYMDHGYSPATMRREVSLSRLLGEKNPFPMIRIPWDRDNPWQAVFLHEVGHNLHADLGIWQENRNAVKNRMLRFSGNSSLSKIYEKWHKEVFADLIAVLLGGPASVWGSMDFLAHPSPKTMTFKRGGVHPTGYLRVSIMADLLERMGFAEDAEKIRKIWRTLYDPARGHRIPQPLLHTAPNMIPELVDEIVFQPRRNLGNRPLFQIIPFGREDEREIRRGAKHLAAGKIAATLPPRFLVSASRYAIKSGRPLHEISQMVIRYLANKAGPGETRALVPLAAAGG